MFKISMPKIIRTYTSQPNTVSDLSTQTAEIPLAVLEAGRAVKPVVHDKSTINGNAIYIGGGTYLTNSHIVASSNKNFIGEPLEQPQEGISRALIGNSGQAFNLKPNYVVKDNNPQKDLAKIRTGSYQRDTDGIKFTDKPIRSGEQCFIIGYNENGEKSYIRAVIRGETKSTQLTEKIDYGQEADYLRIFSSEAKDNIKGPGFSSSLVVDTQGNPLGLLKSGHVNPGTRISNGFMNIIDARTVESYLDESV